MFVGYGSGEYHAFMEAMDDETQAAAQRDHAGRAGRAWRHGFTRPVAAGCAGWPTSC